MATKNTPATKGSTALVSWKDRLAAKAQEAKEQVSSIASGQFIGTRTGQFTWNGNPVRDNKLQVVILDSVFENAYYPGKFDADNPQPPVCFAFGRDAKSMTPHADSAQPQSETCAKCPMNEFESADTGKGKGKACKNIVRLGMVAAMPLSKEGLEKGEIAYLKIPVTSVKSWGAYVRTLDALHKLPPLGVVTEIGSVPDPKSQFKITFRAESPVPDELMESVLNREEEVRDAIEFPYAPPSEEEPKAKKPTAKRKY
jgi:hypothetical protein